MFPSQFLHSISKRKERKGAVKKEITVKNHFFLVSMRPCRILTSQVNIKAINRKLSDVF